MDKKEIFVLKQNLDLLLAGIDPQSNVSFGEDSILKSENNREILSKISTILEYLIKVGMVPSVDKRVKFNFYLSDREKETIKISEEPISISEFVFNINEIIDASNMKKLPATAVTKWLADNGYLKTITTKKGMVFKTLTEKATELELTCVEKTNQYGNKYSVNLYPPKAQKFIVDNLDKIIDYHYGSSTISIE